MTFAIAEAKCEVSIGEPGFPFTAVSHHIKVIVGADKTVKLADHDFRKVSIIPDAVLIHDILQFQRTFQLCSIII